MKHRKMLTFMEAWGPVHWGSLDQSLYFVCFAKMLHNNILGMNEAEARDSLEPRNSALA